MKTILVDAWNTLVTEDGVDEKLHTLLESYQNLKIIVTNANDEEQVTYGMTNLPYELYSLSHNPDKTDPGYFEKLFEDKGLSKDDVIYFEHNGDAVKAAQSLGITSHHYDHTQKDLEAVKSFLDSNV